MAKVKIVPVKRTAAGILFDKIGFKSKSEARRAFGGMSAVEYFRKLRDKNSKKTI